MWITFSMFMGPWSGARPPVREAILKKCIHITWIGLSGRWQKYTVHCVSGKKKAFPKAGSSSCPTEPVGSVIAGKIRG